MQRQLDRWFCLIPSRPLCAALVRIRFLVFGTTIDAHAIVFFVYDPIRSLVLVSFLEICSQQKSLVTDRQKRTPFYGMCFLLETFPFYRRLKEIPKNHPPNCLIACINLSSPYHITANFFNLLCHILRVWKLSGSTTALLLSLLLSFLPHIYCFLQGEDDILPAP